MALQLEDGIPPVKKYARYVKSLHYDSPYNGQYVTRFEWRCLLALLMHPNFPKPIFPNLIQLTLPCLQSKAAMIFASLTISPSLRSVTVMANFRDSVSDHELTWNALADQLGPLSKNLESFSIAARTRSVSPPSTVVGVVDQLCKKFTAITTLGLLETYLPKAPLEFPSTLQKLQLSLSKSDAPRETKLFPSLAHLELYGATVQSCTMFLSALQAPNLQQLTIRYSHKDRDEIIDLEGAFLALVTSAHFPELSSIKVSKDERRHPSDSPLLRALMYMPATFPVTLNVLKPLLVCKRLTSINISNCIPTKISDSDLLVILSAWPKLRSLRLASTFEVDKIPELTLAGLHAAVLRCPSLTHLDLPCDARTLPSAEATPHPSLSNWNVRKSPVGPSSEAAKSLSACFPKLKTLHCFGDLYDKMTDSLFHFNTSTVDQLQVASVVRWREVETLALGRKP
jgi:hypothetical protein